MNELIAITGYPGCGKSELGKALQLKGYRVLSGLFKGEVKERKIKRKIVLGPLPTFIVGFWSHLMSNITKVFFIKTPLEHHLKIYQERGYSLQKSLENIEAIKHRFIESQLKKIKGIKITNVINDFGPFERIIQKIQESLSL